MHWRLNAFCSTESITPFLTTKYTKSTKNIQGISNQPERGYKSALPHEQSCEIIINSRGTQFDLQIVEAFVLER